MWLIVAVLLLAAGVIVAAPAAVVAIGVVRILRESGVPALRVPLGVIASTLAHALVIAALATLLAWPAAWMLRSTRRPALLGAAIAVPLLLPHYLTYAALNLLRAPRTPIGDWLAAQPPWASIAFGKAIAVIGLSLWAWPLAAMVLAPAVRAVPRDLIESLNLDGAGPFWRLRRTLHLARMLRGPIALAVGTVGVVMLGSAVPLHVAQIRTVATELWLALNLTTDPASAWVTAWPVIVAALACGAAMARWSSGQAELSEPDSPPDRPQAGAAWGTALIWGLSVIGPIVLFAGSLHTPGGEPSWREATLLSAAFWRLSGDAVAASAAHGAAVAAGAAVLALASWAAWGAGGVGKPGRVARRVALGCAVTFFITAIVPGVLVGSAVSRTWGASDATAWVGDSGVVLVLAHLARFGVVACAVGWWLAQLESPAVRDCRVLDGATGVRGWWRGRVDAAGLGAVAAAALAAGMLSFHEIEAAVIVQPPGVPSLAQQLLESLHFARDERLAAAAVNLIGAGIVFAGGVGVLLSRAGGRRE